MEAIIAVSVSLVTVYDMAKAVDKSMVIGEISLAEKVGGRSGHWQRSIERYAAHVLPASRERAAAIPFVSS